MFALIDCDHFFVSCERVFRPDLWHKPVAVLSNNDGCIIARSPEVKALGIQMGTPAFLCKAELIQHQVITFSSNFSLYADLSARVIQTIKSMIESPQRPCVEVYSIDEAFIDLRWMNYADLHDVAMTLRQAIFQQTGIPVSIGVGATKTLAKVATSLAKRSSSRVQIIHSEQSRLQALYRLPVEDLWGIGRRWAGRLQKLGIEYAYDLAVASPLQIKRAARHSYLLRVSKELNGEICIPLESMPPARRSIRYSRTFARKIKANKLLIDAISEFARELGHRLRSHQLRTGSLLLWLSAPLKPIYKNRSRPPTYALKLSIALPVYTDDSPTLIHYARHLLSLMIEKATDEAPSSLDRPIAWRKAGLSALDLRDESQLELSIIHPDPKRRKLSEVEDLLNQRFGRGTARIGGIPLKKDHVNTIPKWSPKKTLLSPKYTTCWADLPIVHA